MKVSDFFPFWNTLTKEQQRLLEDSAQLRQARKGTVLHQGGMDCTGLLLVSSGLLRAYILSPEGREITIYRLLEGDICLLSASCMMRSIQFEITIEAQQDSQLWLIPAEVYQSLMAVSAPVANYTNEVMASRFSEVMWLMEQVLWKSFDRRLAAFLLEEADLEGSDILKITHETIGNHLGSAREVVTRMLRFFQSEGAVKLSRGTIALTDRAWLEGIGR